MHQTDSTAGRRWGRRLAPVSRAHAGHRPVPTAALGPATAPNTLLLLIPGGGLLLIGLAYLWRASLPYYIRVPKLQPGNFGNWATVTLGFATAIVCAFALYYAAWRIAAQLAPTRGRIALVFGISAILSAVLAFTYPLLSDDMFYGIVGGRTFGCYGKNPFAVPPSGFPKDPFLPYAGWKDLTMPYGPLWVLISGTVARLSDRGLLATVLAFKALNVGTFLLTTGLLAWLLARRAPRAALSGLVLWAWNPLVLVEVASSAHNDIVMLGLIVVACACIATRRFTCALIALALAIAAKYVAILLAPFFVLYIFRKQPTWRAGVRALMPGGLAAAATLFALYLPFWVGFRTFGPVGEARHAYGSLVAAARYLLPHGDNIVREVLLRGGALLAYAACYVWLLRRAGRGLRDLYAVCHAALLILLLLWPFFMPWYTIWLVPLAALTGQRRLARQIIVLNGAALATYLFQFTLRPAFRASVDFWSTVSAALVFGSLLAVTLAPLVRSALRHRKARRAAVTQPALGV